jgi:AraC-like DNA-binding protein
MQNVPTQLAICSVPEELRGLKNRPWVPRHVDGFVADERVTWYCKIAVQLPPHTANTVQKSIAYMMERLDGRISISELCALVGLSATHFSPLFRSVTGYPPIQFFIRAKIQRACELIEKTDSNLRRIAALLGYKDSLHFSKVFKSVVGVSPSQYRMAIAEKK